MKIPRIPSARPIFPQASKLPLYILESTCRRHLTKSSGVIAVCVRPCLPYQYSLLSQLAGCSDTGNQPTECTGGIVLCRVKLDVSGLRLCCSASFLKLFLGLGAEGLGFAFHVVGSTPCIVMMLVYFES